MDSKKITRIIVICAFFINITALFVTFYSMALYPCVEGVDVCVIEMNPIQDYFIQVGGLPLSIITSLIFWSLVFVYFEVIIIRTFHNKMPRIPILISLFLLIPLKIDLLNDLLVLTVTPFL